VRLVVSALAKDSVHMNIIQPFLIIAFNKALVAGKAAPERLNA